MTKTEMTTILLAAKKEKKKTWATLSAATGLSEMGVASCCYGENSMHPEAAAKLCEALGASADVQEALAEYPTKGNSLGGKIVPTDPLMYRFYEILCVYGTSLKDVIQEHFGDGIMSAIDFTIDVQKTQDAKGDRVIVTLDGKFLPYKRF
jgi:cyanate lyase